MATANVEFEKACKVLGVDTRHASVNNINRAYRALAKKYHPDKNPGVDPALFVGITTAKNTALKHIKDNTHTAAPPAKPLKLEIVPGEMEFANVGRRETKYREFIVYSTGGPFTRFSIDRKHLPKWVHISSITRTTGEELPVRVNVRVTGPESGGLHECNIPVRIENKNTGSSEEKRVRIKLTMKGPKLQLGCKSFEFPADRHSLTRPQVLTLTNAGAGQIKGDLQSQEQWIVIEPALVSFHDRQLVKIRVDTSKLAGRNSGQINVRTNAGDGIITVQATAIPHGAGLHSTSQVNIASTANAFREHAYAGTPAKGWKHPGGTAPAGINISKPARKPVSKSRIREMVQVDSRKAALGVTVAVSSLFLFTIICIANTLPPSQPTAGPPQQEIAQIEQPGKIQDEGAVIPAPAPATQPVAQALHETQVGTIQPNEIDLSSTGTSTWKPAVNHYLPSGYASSYNVAIKLTSSAVPPTTSETNSVQQNNPPATEPVKIDAKPGPDNNVNKKDGKVRHPFQYINAEGPRHRSDNFTNPGPPRFNRGKDK